MFIRTAVLHRRRNFNVAAYPGKQFWVICPPCDVTVYMILSELMALFFGIKVYAVDTEGVYPPQNIGDRIGFYANLLDPVVQMARYENRKDLLYHLYLNLFAEEDHDNIPTWILNGELFDPITMPWGPTIAAPSFASVMENIATPGADVADDDLDDIDLDILEFENNAN